MDICSSQEHGRTSTGLLKRVHGHSMEMKRIRDAERYTQRRYVQSFRYEEL